MADTKANLEARISAEKGACAEKFEFAKMAKAEGNDTLHDTIHEMAKDDSDNNIKGVEFATCEFNSFFVIYKDFIVALDC